MNLCFSENAEGFLIPHENNLSLTGKDPVLEAEQWCRDTLVLDKTCVVVGLGAGFHIAELVKQKKMEKVFVVDTRPGLMNMFRKQFPELHEKVEIIILENGDSLLAHEIMDEVIEHNMSALAFAPCWPKNDLSLRTFHRHLSGRSKESLNLFLKKYGIKKDIQIKDETGQRYLNIKDLELLIQEDVPSYLRLNCFRILKELIL